jgi:competence protein ComEA
MSMFKLACWIVGAVMSLTLIIIQVFKPSSPQDGWENVNALMANTLQIQSTVQEEDSGRDSSLTPASTHGQEHISQKDQQATSQKDQQATPHVAQQENTIKSQMDLAKVSAHIDELININSATLEQLDTLPGIGPSKAKAIIDYRAKYGNFRSLEQLMEVKGVGPKIFAKMKVNITISDP